MTDETEKAIENIRKEWLRHHLTGTYEKDRRSRCCFDDKEIDELIEHCIRIGQESRITQDDIDRFQRKAEREVTEKARQNLAEEIFEDISRMTGSSHLDDYEWTKLKIKYGIKKGIRKEALAKKAGKDGKAI